MVNEMESQQHWAVIIDTDRYSGNFECLALGPMQMPKQFFTGDTIEDVVVPKSLLGTFEADTDAEAANKAVAMCKGSEGCVTIMEMPGTKASWDTFHHHRDPHS